MELALSLGNNNHNNNMAFGVRLGLNGSSSSSSSRRSTERSGDDDHHDPDKERREKFAGSSSPSDPSPAAGLQLDLLPFSPVLRPHPPHPLRFPWLADTLSSEPGSSDRPGTRIVDVNRRPAVVVEEVEEQSSPNSGTSSFMEFSLYTSAMNNSGGKLGRRSDGGGQERVEDQTAEMRGATTTTSRGSDDDENGSRKKLRLSKEQSAFLEESFKEHHTLNPKQKLALAKQLNLRPRQVEVWFQNRRARTKLKQTEVDCEYLKRCCETLTEENRRLQKELQELRALKSSQPFFMHLPATTLTMCPSCERVAPTSTSALSVGTTSTAKPTATNSPDPVTLSLGKPKPKSMLPFANVQAQIQTHQAAV